MKYISSILIPLILLSIGCNDSNSRRDLSDEQNPNVRAGLEQVHQKNWNAAVEKFETALAKNPELARPDLELALIYHQQKKNYIRAIFYYERYLDKRPATEKRPLILDWIRQAKITLASEIGHTAGDISGELVRLTRENNSLRNQLKAFEGQTAPAPVVTNVKTITDEPATQAPAVTPPPVAVAPAPEIPSAPPVPVVEKKPVVPARLYKVVAGDTLMRISRTVYGDSSKWRKIYDANRDKMKTETDLKIGQTIIIPD